MGIRVRRRSWSFVGALAAAGLVVGGVFGLGPGADAPAAAAPAAPGCDYAASGTGRYADTLCWLDLSSVDPAAVGSPQPLRLDLPGGYRLAATMTVTGYPVAAQAFPTWGGAYLGTRGHYTGVDPTIRPALYQADRTGTTGRATTTATLADIAVTDAAGQPVQGWSLVGADAESTARGESITWTSDAPFTSLTTRTDGGDDLGTACGAGFTGIGTTTVTCTGSVDSPTGTAIVAADTPTTFTQRMVGGGREGVAFGVLVSRVSVTKQLVGGFGGDAFSVAVSDAAGRQVATAATTGSADGSATTGDVTVLVSADGNPLTFSERPVGTTDPSRYAAPSWSCTRTGGSGALPEGDAVGTSAAIPVGVGDAVRCTVTNTALPTGLTLTKRAVPVDADGNGLFGAGDAVGWTFTATNAGQVPLTSVAVDDPTAGAVVCESETLAPGDSTTCRTTTPTAVSAADVTAGSVRNTATASAVVSGTTTGVTSAAATAEVPVEQPAVTVAAEEPATPAAGATTVDVPVTVTNPGDVPLVDVQVDVPGVTPTPVPDLAPGEATTVLVAMPVDEPRTVEVAVEATPDGVFGASDPVQASVQVTVPAAVPAPGAGTPTPTASPIPTRPSPTEQPGAVPPAGGGAVGGPDGSLAFTGVSGLPLAGGAALLFLLTGGGLLSARRLRARR
jgi:hypothetical protein